jgi:hypothetical protein
LARLTGFRVALAGAEIARLVMPPVLPWKAV